MMMSSSILVCCWCLSLYSTHHHPLSLRCVICLGSPPRKEFDAHGSQRPVGSLRQSSTHPRHGQRQEKDQDHQSVAQPGVERNAHIVSASCTWECSITKKNFCFFVASWKQRTRIVDFWSKCGIGTGRLATTLWALCRSASLRSSNRR